MYGLRSKLLSNKHTVQLQGSFYYAILIKCNFMLDISVIDFMDFT